MISFITTNKSKFEYASKELFKYGITLKQESPEIVEIQSSNIQDVTKDKAEKAFKMLHSSLIITDTGWEIPALNGFPGAYMHDVAQWFSSEDFLNLLKKKNDKSIIFRYVAIYKDDKREKLFDISLNGKFVNTPKGNNGNSVDKIVTFRKDGKTSAECNDEGINFHDYSEHPLWKVVGEWLKTNNLQ